MKRAMSAGVWLAVFMLGATLAMAQDWPQWDSHPVAADGFRLTDREEEQWNNNRWEPTRRWRRTYTAGGALESETEEAWLFNEWRASRRDTYRYDAAGRLVGVLVQEAVARTLQERGRYTHRHENGRLAETLFEVRTAAGAWAPVRRTTFAYDAAGRKTREESRAAQPPQGAFRIATSYDAAGRAVLESRSAARGTTWVETDRVQRSYTAAGRLDSVTLSVNPGSGWTEALKIVPKYNPDGQRIASVTQSRGRSGALEDAAREQYSFDRDGNQTETSFQSRSNGLWTAARRERFTYERIGR